MDSYFPADLIFAGYNCAAILKTKTKKLGELLQPSWKIPGTAGAGENFEVFLG